MIHYINTGGETKKMQRGQWREKEGGKVPPERLFLDAYSPLLPIHVNHQMLKSTWLVLIANTARDPGPTYNEERQVTKPTPPLQSCRSRTGFRHSRSRSRAVAPDTIVSSYFQRDYFLHPRATALERERKCQNPVRERQLCSGDVGHVTWRSPSCICRRGAAFVSENFYNLK